MLRSNNLPYGPVFTSPEISEFWEATKGNRLLIKHCKACDRPHFYPRSICPRCMSDATEWREAKGSGTIYSFSVMRRVKEPYAIAYVELTEGIKLMTNIVDCDLDDLRVGQRVKLAWQKAPDGVQMPVFTPA